MFVQSMSFICPQIAELDMIHDPRSIDPLILPTRFPTDLSVADHPAAARL